MPKQMEVTVTSHDSGGEGKEDDKFSIKHAEFELLLAHPGGEAQRAAPSTGSVLRRRLWIGETDIWGHKQIDAL